MLGSGCRFDRDLEHRPRRWCSCRYNKIEPDYIKTSQNIEHKNTCLSINNLDPEGDVIDRPNRYIKMSQCCFSLFISCFQHSNKNVKIMI